MTHPHPTVTAQAKWLAVLMLPLCFFIAGLSAADETKKPFDVPAGDAAQTIKLLAQQADREIMFASDRVSGIKTNAVKGDFSPKDAIDLLLAGTDLRALEDEKTGALVVQSVPRPNAQGAALADNSERPNQGQASELGTGAISGSVIRPAGGNSVRGLIVTVAETGLTGTTDAFGRFSISGVAPGSYTLVVTGNDYPELTIRGVVVHSHTEARLAGEVMPMMGKAGLVGETTVAAMQEDDLVELEKYEVMDRKPFVDENMDIVRTENDVQPYYIMDSQQIELSGATNVEDFLRQQLTMNTMFGSNSQIYAGNATSTINLRGLGSNETLILIDGRRSASVTVGGTPTQPDLNGIPLDAIDHIEVLPSSASAIYGGAAVGGVVNVVLKKNYQGGQIIYTYDTPTDADAPLRTLDATYGFTLEGGKTHVMITGHYSDGKPLLVGQRTGLIEGNIGTILKNDPSFLYSSSSLFEGATPNITSTDGSYVFGPQYPNGYAFIATPLTLKNGTPLNSPITYIPAGTAPGTNLTSGLLANAGTYNLNLAPGTGQYGLQNDIGVIPRDKSFMVTVRREMTPWLETFVELSTQSNSNLEQVNSVSTYSLNVPSTAPDNPFQQDIAINIPSALSVPYFNDSVTQSLTVGLLANLFSDWKAELDYTWSQNSFDSINRPLDFTAISSDLASGALNPFVDTIAYPLNLAPYLGYYTYSDRSTLNDLGLRVSGPLWSFPWGRPTLTVGLEHRKEGTDDGNFVSIYQLDPANNTQYSYFGQSQSTNSAYLEAEIPLVTAKNAVPLIRSLDLQLAGRSEAYTVGAGTPYAYVLPAIDAAFFNPPQGVHQTIKYTSSNPTIGLKYKPIEDLTFRVSYAKAFLPPTASELLPNPTLYPSYGQIIYDPQTGQTYGGFQTTQGGNPDLKPQTSADWDLGVIWEPKEDFLKGLRVDLEYYRIIQPNYIIIPSPQEIVGSPAYASRVTRDPTTGLITAIDTSFVNASEYKTAGWDLSLDYRKSTAIGIFDLHAVGTVIEQDARQYTIGSPFLNYVGYLGEGGEGKTKANLTISWQRRGWTLGWTTTYYGGYNQQFSLGSPEDIQYFDGVPYPLYTGAQGGNTIPSQIYHEIFAGYAFGTTPAGRTSGIAHGLLSNVTIRAGIKNVFNALPPFDAASEPYYYSVYGDPRLRDIWVSVKKDF